MNEQRYNEFREAFYRNNGYYPNINELQQFVNEKAREAVATDDQLEKINDNSRLRRELERNKVENINRKALKERELKLRTFTTVAGTMLLIGAAVIGTAAVVQAQSPVAEVNRALEGAYHVIDPVTGRVAEYSEGKVDLYARKTFIESAALYMLNNNVSNAVAEEILIAFFTNYQAALDLSVDAGTLTEERYKEQIHEMVTGVYLGQEIIFQPYSEEVKSR